MNNILKSKRNAKGGGGSVRGDSDFTCVIYPGILCSRTNVAVSGVIQSVDEGKFINYFCPLVFVKGLQLAITWTEE